MLISLIFCIFGSLGATKVQSFSKGSLPLKSIVGLQASGVRVPQAKFKGSNMKLRTSKGKVARCFAEMGSSWATFPWRLMVASPKSVIPFWGIMAVWGTPCYPCYDLAKCTGWMKLDDQQQSTVKVLSCGHTDRNKNSDEQDRKSQAVALQVVLFQLNDPHISSSYCFHPYFASW